MIELISGRMMSVSQVFILKIANAVIWYSMDYSTTMEIAAFESSKRGKFKTGKRNFRVIQIK
jgi:hypothetical protein